MARHYIPQTYKSINELRAGHRTQLPHPYDWRLLPQQIVGAIHGLPEFRGVAIATNGVIVAILQGNSLVYGHMDYFVADEQRTETKPSKPRAAKQPKSVNMNEFI